MASFINISAILQNIIILYLQDDYPNLLFEKVLTQLTAFQSYPNFICTEYSDFIYLKHQYVCSVIYYKYYIDSIYDNIQTSMALTTLITETHPTKNFHSTLTCLDFPS